MKLNIKNVSNNLEDTNLNVSVTTQTDSDREVQRLKWRIYKRRYRQKIRRKNRDYMPPRKRTAPKKVPKVVKSTAEKTSWCIPNDDSKQKLIKNEPIDVQIVNELPNIKRKLEEQISTLCKKEEMNRELIRCKWREYKRNYRQKMRDKEFNNHTPRIVEEDTAIYFVEDDSSNSEYIYENDLSETDHLHEYESHQPVDFDDILELKDLADESITVNCEPYDCILIDD